MSFFKLHDFSCVCICCMVEQRRRLKEQDKRLAARELRERSAAKALGMVKI